MPREIQEEILNFSKRSVVDLFNFFIQSYMDFDDSVPRRLGIVWSWEKDVAGNYLSLEKYKGTGCFEVFCPASEFVDFSMGEGMLVVIEKGSLSW